MDGQDRYLDRYYPSCYRDGLERRSDDQMMMTIHNYDDDMIMALT